MLSEALAERGVKFLSTRSIGYDNIDIAAASAAGIRVSGILYSPKSVTECTLMMLLMTVRRMKLILDRGEIQDYLLEGSDGRHLSEMTIGITGAGRIGSTVARPLQPLGCNALACDLPPNPQQNDIVEFVDLETLLHNSDAITLHVPAMPMSHHMIDAEQFAMMR